MACPRRARLLAAAALLSALAGCAAFEPVRDQRGNRLDAERVQEIQPGVHARTDVASLLGSPTLTGAFDDRIWYYASAVSRARIARQPVIEDQKVIAVHFNERGIVDKVEELDQAEARQIEPVARVTPTPGTERNFLQQLFGNIGRFTGAGAGGDGGGGG